jgi:hypothetical protein
MVGKSNKTKHPQDEIIDKIINRICTKTYGDNWEHPKNDNLSKNLSTFD